MKFAFITPRYGAEIGAGPEHACRLLAERVSDRHDVDVLTTCAHDPGTWRNGYPEGADRVRGVLVRRFAVSQPFDRQAFDRLTAALASRPGGRTEELEWVRRLGPWSPGLLEFLTRQQRSYDAFVFFSMWHPTTVHGVAIAPDRSVLFPHLQLRPALRFGLWSDVLRSVRALGLLSEAERPLLRHFVGISPPDDDAIGIGVDPPPQQSYPRHQQDPADTLTPDDDAEGGRAEVYLARRGIPFRRRHRLHGDLVLYSGRVEPDNGCEEMLEYFHGYAAEDGDTSLVLMGVKMMRVADEPYLRMPGVLPERERMNAYEAADVTIAPASDDMLAQSVLESFAVGTPVLASARNDAAVEHCRRADAGLYYADRAEFVDALRLLMGDAGLRARLGDRGRDYIRQHFRWEAVLGRFDRLIGRLRSR